MNTPTDARSPTHSPQPSLTSQPPRRCTSPPPTRSSASTRAPESQPPRTRTQNPKRSRPPHSTRAPPSHPKRHRSTPTTQPTTSLAAAYGILQPRQLPDGTYQWPSICIKDSPGKGRGVFSTQTLLPGTRIPIIGVRRGQHAVIPINTHTYTYKTIAPHTIDGHPDTLSSPVGVACHGLAIAMMINEPATSSQANAIFTEDDYILIIRTLNLDEEITVYYGNTPTLTDIRNSQGYATPYSGTPKLQTAPTTLPHRRSEHTSQ